MTPYEQYDNIMGRVSRFEEHIDDKTHEDIADFYTARFDEIQSIVERLLREGREVIKWSDG